MEEPTPPKKRTPPIAVRAKDEEIAWLDKVRGHLSRSAFCHWLIFKAGTPPPVPKRRNQNPIKDHKALAQLMGLLGQSRIRNNANQLAKAVNTGSLPVTPETEARLIQLCDDIAEMLRLLLQALGREVRGE